MLHVFPALSFIEFPNAEYLRVTLDGELHLLATPLRIRLRGQGLRVLRPVVRWAQGPLRFFIGRLTPGQLGLELTTLLAIAAVGSFAYFGYWILLSGADAAASHQAVINVMDAARRSGLPQITFATQSSATAAL